ncbi:MAG: response regulator transcription factor, partial [Thermoguttaceae bacterium]
IFISAKSEEIDKVVGLELGADDFIVKPFGVKEVVARIRAVTRRCCAARTKQPESFRMDDLEVFPGELRARRGEKTIDLSLRDVKILELFHRRRGQVLDRNTIFNDCWGEDYLPNSRTLDQHISQLRKRIEVSPKEPKLIRTVHGAGYRFEG